MKLIAYRSATVIIAALVFTPLVSADEIGDLRAGVLDAITKLAARYESRISELESENAKLRNELATLKSSVTPVSPTAPISDTSIVPTWSGGQSISSGNTSWDVVIAKITSDFPRVLKDHDLPTDTQMGVFEFVNGTGAVFVSLDDEKNPEGVTAFKNKILYRYDASGKIAVMGVFDLDYASQKYRTLSGSNPFGGSVRTKVKNPSYKGKLLDLPTTSTSVSSVVPTITPSAPVTISIPTNVSAKEVRSAYDKNKLKDAVSLANVYLKKIPNDTEILTIRYRSLYILGKYADSLKDVQTIESLQWAKFDCTIAKDAAFIAKAAKNTVLATKYGAMCKKP